MVSSDPNSPSVTQIVFAPGTDGLPWSSTATLSVTYTTSSGEVRSQAGGRWHVVFNSMAHNAPSSHQGSPRPVSFSHLVFMQSVDIDLPMCLFCCVVPPVKTACEKPVTMCDCFECVCGCFHQTRLPVGHQPPTASCLCTCEPDQSLSASQSSHNLSANKNTPPLFVHLPSMLSQPTRSRSLPTAPRRSSRPYSTTSCPSPGRA